MAELFGYPFDVIKTNRILQTDLSKSSFESLPKELESLYDHGKFRRGFFRGLVPAILAAQVAEIQSWNLELLPIGALAASIACNPLEILNVER